MKHFGVIFLTVIFFILISNGSKGQVVTITNPANTTPNLAATYTSLFNALSALNGITGISGPVTITLNPGNAQTTPSGGYVISFANIINTSASPVTIEGSNNTITAFAPQPAGNLNDAIFKIIGADYITLQHFTMQENAANTTATPIGSNNMTEWGVALLYTSATDGAQNNTIQNNIISLNNAYSNTFGIYSNVRHTPSAVGTAADISNNTTAPNKGNKIYGNSISNVNMGITFIGSAIPANMDTGNDIGGSSSLTGNTIINWGSASTAVSTYISNSGSYHGIFVNHQKDDNVSYNTITSATLNGASGNLRAIYKAYKTAVPTGTFTSTISYNTITITNNLPTGNDVTGIYSEGISPALTTATININNNNLLNIAVTTAASSNNIIGISNTSQPGALNINSNLFRGNTSAATTGGFTAIVTTGAVTTTLNINNNNIGDATGDAVTFSAATSGSLVGISCPTVAATAAVSISNNNFKGFVQTIAGSGAHSYITLTHAPSSATTDNINANSFTNLSANTTGNVTFISRVGAMALSAGATENCNNNKIITAFSKPAVGGTVSLYSTASTCLSGNTMTETGNDFSNITLTGATIMNGWNNTEGGASGPTKTISNNVFKNWIGGSSAIFVIQSNGGGDNTAVSGNDIENISGSGPVTIITQGSSNKGTSQSISNNIIATVSSSGSTVLGITGGSATTTTLTISGNNINTLSSSGPTQVEGIKITASGTTNLLKNKLYDISAQNVSCTVFGIDIATATVAATYNIVNNIVGNLTANLTSNTLAIRGISFSAVAGTATFNIYYNTVYINAASSGTDFGTTALYLTTSGTAATGAASVRNNIFVNTSTASGAGLTVSYRRSSVTLTNYAAASNNNIFYGGTPSSTNLVFYDGTNSDQTLAAFKTRVGPTRESSSLTELPPFLTTSGASANFLHIDPTIPTQAESGAVNIPGYTDDYDGNIRQGNTGYAGTGTAPDIGADEFEGITIEHNPPVITYTAITTPSCLLTGMAITGVTITDATGIPLSGSNVPRIYYKKNSGSWFSQPGINTGGTATNSTWNFTIVETDMGGVTGGDIVSYYIIAQDITTIINTGSNPAGVGATSVNNVITAPPTPYTYTLKYTLNGTYSVGVGGNFTTLTAAVSAYNNACALTGPVIFELTDNTYGSETFPITINNHVDASAINTLTIRPSATATPVITGNSTLQTISLDGARYIRIDGRQGGAGTNKSLTISTSSTGVTINFVDDAQNNIIKYCIVKGQRVSSFSGTIFFGAAASGTGNDNNSIDNNDINEAGGFSSNGIYSGGTTGKENDNISITNNNIFNFFNATNDSHGIFIFGGSNSWTITGNHFYQTATRVYTSSSPNIFGIYIIIGTGYTINNNVIGFANSSGTGTTNMIGNSVTLAGFPSSYSVSGTGVPIRYVGIALSLPLIGTPSTVDGNTIGGFAMYTSSNASTLFGMFGGIYVESGTVNIGVNAGNIIGATTGNNSIYVATSGSGGTIVGIREACIFSSSIRNNSIGAITVSGTSNTISGSFTGISIAGTCNYAVSNNVIGNADADNIRIGYALTGGLLSNTGSLTATTAAATAAIKGISNSSTGNILSITNNTLRGWTMSCSATVNTGIESSGAMTGSSASVDINNNFIGTAVTNWVNTTIDNTGFFYAITVSNTAATINNIKNNDFRGTFFGTQNGVGGGLIKLTGATSANNIATISGNTFTNLSLRFSTASLYFIYTNYTLSSTGQLIVDNNKIVGTFNSTGLADYHMVHCAMSSASGSLVSITNNNFSNVTAATGFSADLHGLYSDFAGNPCLLTITGNTLSNWTAGTGSVTGIDISNLTGTTSCTNNMITNIATRHDVEGISLGSSGSSGLFTVTNNTITSLVSTGAGGYINGISIDVPAVSNTTQTNIGNNIMGTFSSPSPSGILAGIYLRNGHTSSALSISSNKIYDISESATDSHVYGIYNESTLSGNITYTNNYIGDLRTPISGSSTDPPVVGLRLYMAGGQSNVYYNTIYLSASGTSAQFTSAAVYVDPATQVSLRNNIFINVSTPGSGGSGKAVSYWRGDTNLGTYDATSNNNDFYAGTASTKNLIFYDGTNKDQTLATYQTRVSTRDNLSVSALPNFISTTGSNVSFLHIAATGNCSVNASGSNSGILLATDYDNDARSIVAPFVTDIGADEFSKKNAWTGTNGTNWNDTGNWSEGVVPNTNDDNVVINNPPVNQPVIASGDIYQVASVIIGTGATLTNRGILKVAGSVYGPLAGIDNTQAGLVTGSVEMDGNCSITQPLAGNVFVNNAVNNFKVSNDVKISSVSGEGLNITGALSFGSTGKTLTTGDNITLVSTVNATANIADVTGNTITGKATVERYINTGLVADGRHLKSWQFLSTPTVGATVFQSWQESGTTPAGYGTIITGTGTGFDITTALPSMKFYTNSTNTWTGITNTGSLINDQRGYMLFVRGDRSVTAYNQNAVPTTLRTKGTLYQPSALPPVTTVQAGKLESVGNPYASAIDVSYMKSSGLFVNLDNDVTVWDPLLAGTWNLGGYQTLSSANNYEPTAGSTATAYYPAGVPSSVIQSGQAFFVHSAGSVGSVTFTEACKTGTNRLVNKPIITVDTRQYFRTTLFTPEGVIADGNAVVFNYSFNNRIDKDDSYKITNGGENFGLIRDEQILAVEARSPVNITDTIFYNMFNLRKQSYQLRFAPKNMQSTGLKAFLIDRYLNSSTLLSLTDSNFVNILINDDSLSYASNRFYVIFRKRPPQTTTPGHSETLPVDPSAAKGTVKPSSENKIASINIYPNPVENKIIQLQFINQPKGIYRIELVNKLGQPVYNGSIEINASSITRSLKIPDATAAGTYQLNIVATNGIETVLQVIVR